MDRKIAADRFLMRLKNGEATNGQPIAQVQRNIAKNNVFVDVTIEGHRFQGSVSKFGTSLLVTSNTASSYLGVTSLTDTVSTGRGTLSGRTLIMATDVGRWHLCKYQSEPKGEIPLSAAGRAALAIEFGLPIIPLLSREERLAELGADLFYASPAFQYLCEWARAHPRKIRKCSWDSYLGLWALSAIEGRRVPTSKENIDRAKATMPTH